MEIQRRGTREGHGLLVGVVVVVVGVCKEGSTRRVSAEWCKACNGVVTCRAEN